MKIVILYGSENDKAYLEPGRAYLAKNGVAYEERVLSVHRNFDELTAYLDSLKSDPAVGVVLAVAGLSAALPGIVAVRLDVPVIGVPVPSGPLGGMDALLSIVQSPGDVPVASVGLHPKAPLNACILAHRILKLKGRD
ncbi:MAG: phosphoribosylaminoimidazole carboxylase [Candidatus Lindowbacteria bacterium RIFCSPLOWO2_12_FULL_62_27]|nr:MAG: phosphoribosylaminoimidazole carboxylase [Candidatus Lindowbacteria bacterium RIFCSPLOWO2_12_FULL_62_27]OGH62178.1 MAG: phosphoribosylaminoimidazole carboxylase [Candidatus Lindowbacteria bacterium RIFCSPLOWO2_02_FULL_62_12]